MILGNEVIEELIKNGLVENRISTEHGECTCPNAGSCILYQEILGDIENTLGYVPGFMRFLHKETIIRDWPMWKLVGEIDMERATYLLSTDDMLEEMLDKTN